MIAMPSANAIAVNATGVHRKDSPQDIVIIGALGMLLLGVLPAKEPEPARAQGPLSARTRVQPSPAEAQHCSLWTRACCVIPIGTQRLTATNPGALLIKDS